MRDANRAQTAEPEKVNGELHRRTEELEQALNARSRFYASMSHELRTPINAILGYSALLLDQAYGPLNEAQINGIERTHRAARRLLDLVNDVLDISKIDAGKIELRLEAVRFPLVIDEVFADAMPMAEEHGSELILEQEGRALTVISDPRRVRQILLNLLSNAIRLGPGKPVRVISRSRGERGIEVYVLDQGAGMATEDLSQVFDNPPAQDHGSGLGLAIAQRLAIMLGGSLTVESQRGVGSTFCLRLPRVADALTSADTVPQHAGFTS